MVAMVWDRSIPETVAEDKVTVADLSIRLLRKGKGPSLFFVHDCLGNLGWLPLYEKLAKRFTVTVPDLPGYGQSARPEWARSPRDIAILLHLLLDKLELNEVTLVGLGFGGYIAAEMATMNQSRFSSLVLVGATGIRPREGQIADPIMTGFTDYGLTGFKSVESFQELFGVENELPQDLYELWDFSTEMTARICWKPWMYSRQLPHLLGEIRLPTLLVSGKQDRLVPLDIARQYESLLLTARVELVDDAGHFVDLEQPEALARLIQQHAGKR